MEKLNVCFASMTLMSLFLSQEIKVLFDGHTNLMDLASNRNLAPEFRQVRLCCSVDCSCIISKTETSLMLFLWNGFDAFLVEWLLSGEGVEADGGYLGCAQIFLPGTAKNSIHRKQKLQV